MPKPIWSIAFGDYELVVDRKALTYRLTETKTGTLWADGLSLGWVALEDRETGEITRHAFGEMTQFSVSEKAGPQGKRILFGLDIHGVPVDLYLICSLRVIQMVVEANRDSKTHHITEFCLLPGLCSIPDDDDSFLVAPVGGGMLWFARDAPDTEQVFSIWDGGGGAGMPFVGAVRAADPGRTAIALITDSVYGAFHASKQVGTVFTFDTHYARDPERRRLDLRVVPLPGGDHVAIARAYREKIIGENNHVTLRKKMRERAKLNEIIGAPFFWILQETEGMGFSAPPSLMRRLRSETSLKGGLALLWRMDEQPIDGISKQTQEAGFLTVAVVPKRLQERFTVDFASVLREDQTDFVEDYYLCDEPFHWNNTCSRWEEMDNRMRYLERAHTVFPAIGSQGSADWAAISIDYMGIGDRTVAPATELSVSVRPPLLSVIYHDAVVLHGYLKTASEVGFLRLLVGLFLPYFELDEKEFNPSETLVTAFIKRTTSVLCPLHRLTCTAFLIAHRFLTPDFLVEEAVYSDKTRVVINQSEAETYNGEDVTLPPLGFYVRHAQMEAHDALRVGDQTFATRAWRIARSRDGKPLEESEDVLRQEFPV